MIEYTYNLSVIPRPVAVHRALHLTSSLQPIVDGVNVREDSGAVEVRFSRKLKKDEKAALDQVMAGGFDKRRHNRRGRSIPADAELAITRDDLTVLRTGILDMVLRMQDAILGKLENMPLAAAAPVGSLLDIDESIVDVDTTAELQLETSPASRSLTSDHSELDGQLAGDLSKLRGLKKKTKKTTKKAAKKK